jgi:FAD/FMN-containing dehydrogenase
MDVLRGKLRGVALLPDDSQYCTYAKAWNLSVEQHPAVIVVPESADDIVVAVRFASEHDLGVGVMATGHGVGKPCNGGLLLNTSQMRVVKIDPSTRTAKVDAGTIWKDVIAAASECGLATFAGSAPHVGVIGYTMGGGFSYLSRKYGLNSSGVTAAEIVTADGRLVHANENENKDLLWGVKGGGGNFGIVTSLTFRLHPVTEVYGGAVFYSIEHARELITFFSTWAKQVPDEITVAFAFMNVPDIPAVLEFLRGRSVIVLKGCYCGEDLPLGEKLFEPIRKLFKPIADTFRIMSVTEMDGISKDPVDPTGVLQFGTLLRDLTPGTIDVLIATAGVDSSSPLLIVELRRLGGALEGHRGDMKLMGEGNAKFSLNAIGATVTPAMTEKVVAHLSLIENVVEPYTTKEVFLNFVEVDPSPERVRVSYTAQDWKKLRELKRKVDPDNLFRFNRNIPPSNE